MAISIRSTTRTITSFAQDRPRAPDWAGRRVTVMGLGRHGGGLAAARYLAGEGARVTISDMADRETLCASLERLADVSIDAIHLGGHRGDDFRKAGFVVVNPVVRPDHAGLGLGPQSG